MAKRKFRIAQVGAGMFGGDVHLRAYSDLQRNGMAGLLARIGMDAYAKELADVDVELACIATRTKEETDPVVARFKELTGHEPQGYWGRSPWEDITNEHDDIDFFAVATPDPLHTPVVLHALRTGHHCIVEKPMCLFMSEADQICAAAKDADRVCCVDMHKRYDPDHLRIRDYVKDLIGPPIYGRAILEEPLEVSTQRFKWVEESDPFSYVGAHWVDLIYSYYKSKPVGLSAVGQKIRLIRDDINAYDAVQVRVDYANGMSIYYQNNWITPPDFEANVNQEHEIVGADGKVESDQQYRGFRYWSLGGGMRSNNNHFTRDVLRPDGSAAYIGYGTDSIHAALVAAMRYKFCGHSLKDLEGAYVPPEDGRHTVAIVNAARAVRDRNFEHIKNGRPPCVTAGFGDDGITVIDPYHDPVFEKIYDQPV